MEVNINTVQSFINSWTNECSSPTRRARLFQIAAEGQQMIAGICTSYKNTHQADDAIRCRDILLAARAEQLALVPG